MNYKVFKETILKYTAEYGKNGPYKSPTKKAKNSQKDDKVSFHHIQILMSMSQAVHA
jgi:hypothetical protein